MRIQVRKCPFTGKIFEESKITQYVAHLAKVRTEQKQARYYERIRKEFAAWLAKEKEDIVAISMIVPWLLKNQRTIMDAHNAINCTSGKNSWHSPFYADDEFTSFALRASYTNHASNTHVCPEGGVTNFGVRNSTAPTGYPGFKGYITGSLRRSKKNNGNYPYTDMLKLIGIKTGSGGGGNENWGYDFTLFLADWPGLSQEVVASKLRGVIP